MRPLPSVNPIPVVQPCEQASEPFCVPRRQFLWNAASGMASVALACLLQEEANGQHKGVLKGLHFKPKVKRVIHIFCAGGVSHLDTFDYKPELVRRDGQSLTDKGTIDTFFAQPGNLMRPLWEFRQRGKSGLWVSDLLPNLAECVDDMTFLYGMTGKNSNHTPATFFMNTGFTMNGYPCLGSWVSYGLGSPNQDLPAFVVLPDPRGLPASGSINWTNGFLPAAHQGVALRTSGEPVPNLFPGAEVSATKRKAGMNLLGQMNTEFLKENAGDSALAARIRSYELAAKMQTSIPDVVNFDNETDETKSLYGLDRKESAGFGRNCLLARRLAERGVRFIMLFNGGAFGSPRINWDGHEDVKENHTTQAATMDRPTAGLLKDLKRRGMLDDTLLVWTTEFGRTPITQGVGKPGRDHHQHVFTVWMAGGGLKPGLGFGSSDEVGYFAAEHPVQVYDLHATILRLLGVDHKRLTFYHNGIQRRLTDVHGEVIKGILTV